MSDDFSNNLSWWISQHHIKSQHRKRINQRINEGMSAYATRFQYDVDLIQLNDYDEMLRRMDCKIRDLITQLNFSRREIT